MAYTVEPSFDYANIKVDYKNKKVDVSYPYKTSVLLDLFIFAGIGIGITGVGSLIITSILSLLNIGYNPLFILLLIFVGWMAFCIKTKYIREILIKTGLDKKDYNQIYISGIKSKKIRIKNVHNYFTSYDAEGDYAELIESFEIKCVEFVKGELTPHKYSWEIIITFSDVPREGKINIYNQVDRGSSIDTTKAIEIEEIN